MQILDGKALAAGIRDRVKSEIDALVKETGILPGLTVIIVGDDPASRGYVRTKNKTAAGLGIRSRVIEMDRNTSPEKLTQTIEALNGDAAVHAILVQLPLPGGFDTWKILDHLDPSKDVDRFLPVNLGRIMLDRTDVYPCTPAGVMVMLDHQGIDLKGKNAVVVGRSFIVGKPLAAMMTNRHATVTLCHSRTTDLGAWIRRADIVVAAVGKPGVITADMIMPGAVLIDVGTNYLTDRREVDKYCTPDQREKFETKGYGITGDIPVEAHEKASFVTPVPGGVGPMTVAMLMENTLRLYRSQMNLDE